MSSRETPAAVSPDVDSELSRRHDDPVVVAHTRRDLERRRRRAYWILAGSAFAFLALAVGIAVVIERQNLYAPVAALNRRLADEGLPTTWEGVRAAAPRPPAELDGTADWERTLAKHGRVYTHIPSLVELPSGKPTVEQSFAQAEERSAAWRSDLRRLADSGTYRATKYDRAWLTELDYLYHCDAAACELDYCNYLLKRAKHLRSIGDADEAAESLYLELAIVKNSTYEPLFAHSMGDYALTGACKEIDALLAGHRLSADRWRQLQESLERCHLRGSCASMALHDVIYLRDLGTESEGLAWEGLNFVDERVARHVLVERLEIADGFRRAQRLPPSERLDAMRNLDTETDRMTANAGWLVTEPVREFAHADCSVYPAFIYDGLLHFELYRQVAETRRRACVAGIACRRFEMERGSLPQSWNDLSEFGIADPPVSLWTQEAMALARNEDGSISIGVEWPPDTLRDLESIPPQTSSQVERFEELNIPASP